MRGALLVASALLLLLACSSASAFYLPGVAPRDYAKGDAIGVKVIKLDSNEKQVTIRAAINKRIKTTGVDGVKVRAMGKDRLVVEAGARGRRRGRRPASEGSGG